MASEPRWLQPMSMGDVFDEAFQLYRDHFGPLFIIALIAYLIPIAVNLIANATGLSLGSGAEMPTTDSQSPAPLERFQSPSTQMIESNWLLTVADFLAFSVSYAALAWAVANRYLGTAVSIGHAYGSILSRLLPYLFTMLLVVLMFIGAGLLFIIPVLGWIGAPILIVILLFMTAFVNPVFVIEDRRYANAIGRSRELAQGNWGRLFILGLVSWLITQLPSLLFVTVIASPLIADTLANLASALLMPVPLAAVVILYFDIRVREEGFDLELLTREVGRSPSPHSGETTGPYPESPVDDDMEGRL